MAHSPATQTLQRAIQHHQAGRLPEAEVLYREVLAHDSTSPDALHLLGVIEHQQGRHAQAVTLIRQAAARAPTNPAIHSNLGEAHRHLGQFDEAVASFRRALALQPNYPDALNNLGSALAAQGKFDEALACFQQAIGFHPTLASAHYNLGNLFKDRDQFDQAIVSYRQALALNSNFPEAHNNLGEAFRQSGRFDEAVGCFRQALALKPDLATAHNNLGGMLKDRGQPDDAAACFQQALTADSALAEAHNNLGLVFRDRGRLDEALAAYQRALALNPRFAEARNNLGSLYKDRGQLDEALSCYRQAITLQPDRADFHSNLILALHYRSGHEAAVIEAELRRWNERHARPLARFLQPHPHDRSPDRRLRIGYVSPDFRHHPVGWFLRPLFAARDRAGVELFCYSNSPRVDDLTRQLRSHADTWREIAGLPDRAVADQIRQDRIDVLVDLAVHTANNRLTLFAHRPAPVQATYLGYPGSTGLAAIDYRLTDRHLDPLDPAVPPGHEAIIPLPDTYWCYQPAIQPTPAVVPPPVTTAGYVTFACLNNFCKVTPAALAVWCRLLAAVPSARLLVHAQPGVHRSNTLEFVAQNGLDPRRICFAGRVPEAEYFQMYQSIDVALDPFPFPGGTTTCDALWMGVPVITLAGPTPVTRGGLSLLSNVGLSELVAYSVDEYIEKAAALARDLPRLRALRASLRDRMQRSPLTDASRFAHQLEAAYRTMWRRWCAQPASAAGATG